MARSYSSKAAAAIVVVRSRVCSKRQLKIKSITAVSSSSFGLEMTCFLPRHFEGHNMAAQRVCALSVPPRALPRFPRGRTRSRAMSTMSKASSTATTIVSAKWLAENAADVKLLDCSWYLPAMGRDAKQEHAICRIPGARYFDVDKISDPDSSLPHMLPSAESFASACDALGIENGDQVVVYDGAGLFSAARAWWMFKVFGHCAVAVLDGGVPGWLSEGMATDVTPVTLDVVNAAARASRGENINTTPKFKATLDAASMRSKQDVLDRCVGSNKNERLVDARPTPRWAGAAPELRPGVRSGRVPDSKCVPFFSLLDAETKRMKSKTEILSTFAAAGVDLCDLKTPLVASCGTGITACVLSLAAAVAVPERPKGLPVYDGSWTEWGSEDSGCPVETD
jgi:thiosulfate/3-mercaptopyruvate sulfurtransferase